MPVGTAGDGQGDVSGRGARARRRRRARQHLSSDAGARAPSGRRARRAAQIHELAASDPHRFRRLPGDEPRQAAQARRARRRVPIAYRRLAPRADAGARDGDPGPARFRHPDAVRRMRPPAVPARARPSARCACRCAGPSARKAAFGDAAGPGDLRHRPGRRRDRSLRIESARGLAGMASTAMRSAAWRSASRRRSCSR